MSRSRWDYALLVAALTVGGWLRFFELGKHALWLDEATTAAFAGRSFEAMFFAETQHPPFYNVLVWLWVRVFGDSDASVRVLPAIFGTLTILAAWLLSGRIQNSRFKIQNDERSSSFAFRVSIFAAWLTALSPFLIYFSQENRSYALLMLLAVLSTWAFLRWQQSGRGLWLYALLGALMMYTHYFGAFVLLAHETVFWRSVFQSQITNRKSQIYRWVAARSAVLIAFWPWVVWVSLNFAPQAREWVGAPLPRIPSALIRYLLGYGVVARDLRTTPLEEILRLEVAYVAPMFLLMVWLVWRGIRIPDSKYQIPNETKKGIRISDSKFQIPNKTKKDAEAQSTPRNAEEDAGRMSYDSIQAAPSMRQARWLMGAVLILPFAILLPISPWMRLIHERYLSFQAPFVLLLAAFGLASLRRRAQIAAAGATLASLAFLLAAYLGAPGHLLGYELRFMKEDWRGAAAFVRESRPDVVIVAPHYICLPLDRYLPEKPGPRHIRMPDRFADVPQISPRAGRIALVIAREGPPQTKLREQMDARFRRVAERSFWPQNPIHVMVYEWR